MRILVLGITGMLGNAVFSILEKNKSNHVFGTLRNAHGIRNFSEQASANLISGIDVLENDSLIKAFELTQPDVVVNCVGLIKQLESANDPLTVLPINSILPHRLARICSVAGSRLIHISTDCVFSGTKGMYVESDESDATDLYGKSKFIGEISDRKNAITLRTSIIGHELGSKNALVEWFLSQTKQVKGYANAIFSGLPTVELAKVIDEYVIPNPDLYGLYHVSSEPIDKFTLLNFIAKSYGKDIEIVRDDVVKIDRSLDSSRFKAETKYNPPSWSDLIDLMRINY